MKKAHTFYLKIFEIFFISLVFLIQPFKDLAVASDFSIPYEKLFHILLNTYPSEKYKDAGALVLYERKVLKIKKDGSYERIINLVVEILNDRGKEEFGDLKIDFDPRYEKISFGRLCVITGEDRYEVAKNAINFLTPKGALHALRFFPKKRAIVSFSHLKKGAVIEFNAKIETDKKMYDGYVFGKETFGYDEPILRKEFVIIFPKKRKVFYKVSEKNGLSIKIKKREIKGKIEIEFWAEDLPKIFQEDYMPPYETILPTVYYTSFSTWKDLFIWLKVRVLKEFSTGLTFSSKKEAFLYDLFDINTLDVPFLSQNFCVEPKKYLEKAEKATPLGKIVILFNLLKNSGFSPKIVFAGSSSRPFFPDFPTPSQFESAFLLCDGIYMDPSKDLLTFGDVEVSDSYALEFDEKSFKLRKLEPKSKILRVQIDIGKSFGKIQMTGSFGFSEMIRSIFQKDTEREKEIEAQNILHSLFFGTKLQKMKFLHIEDLFGEPKIEIFFSGKVFLDEGEFKIFKVPKIPFLGKLLEGPFAKEKRKFAITFDYPLQTEFILSLKIPDGYFPTYIPKNKVYIGDYLFLRKDIVCRDKRIDMFFNIIFPSNKIPKKSYRDVRKALEDSLSEKETTFIFKEI